MNVTQYVGFESRIFNNRLFFKTIYYIFNPHMLEIFLQLYCMEWVHGDPQKGMLH